MDAIKFEKVSFQQYLLDNPLKDVETAFKEWEEIKLPVRATKGSAGYDFFLPYDICLEDGQQLDVYTGIRCSMPINVVLLCMPKSGIGSRYRLQFNNTIGVVDCDFFYSDNEGHIKAVIINDNRLGQKLELNRGKAFFQGVFVNYLTTIDDCTNGIRNGGYESTRV